MTEAAERLLKDALDLSDRERAEMAARLIESLDAETDSTPDETAAAWVAEIDRRCDALDAGTTGTRAWEDVRREVEASLRRR